MGPELTYKEESPGRSVMSQGQYKAKWRILEEIGAQAFSIFE